MPARSMPNASARPCRSRGGGRCPHLRDSASDAGRDNFLQLLDADRDRAAARAALASPNAQVADAQVSLFKALGGGWENAPEAQRRQP